MRVHWEESGAMIRDSVTDTPSSHDWTTQTQSQTQTQTQTQHQNHRPTGGSNTGGDGDGGGGSGGGSGGNGSNGGSDEQVISHAKTVTFHLG